MTRRRLLVAVAAGVVGVLAGVASAFACVNLAELKLSATSGPAGARITATGTGYSVVAPVLPVILRWNGTEGPVLAQAVPNARGEISATFTVPDGIPGYYVVVGVHKDAAGVDRYGTPSRASYQILGPGPAPAPAPTLTTLPATTRLPARPTTTGVVRTTTTTSTSTTSPPPATSATTSTTLAPVAVVPAAVARSDGGLPAPAVAVAGVLLLGVAVALWRQAAGSGW